MNPESRTVEGWARVAAERETEIERLRETLSETRDHIQRAYGELPTDVFPGPPTQIVERIDKVLGTQNPVEARALAKFTEYFVNNYPGPNTIIGNPHWHAPRIFRAALHALKSS